MDKIYKKTRMYGDTSITITCEISDLPEQETVLTGTLNDTLVEVCDQVAYECIEINYT